LILPSAPVEITPALSPSVPLPIIERSARPASTAPELNSSTGDTVSIAVSGGSGTLPLGEENQPAIRFYQDTNGFAFQQGTVTRYGIRTENTRTGEVQIFDRSQLSDLSQLLTPEIANRLPSIPPTGSAISFGNGLGLNVGVYKVQVRVQYLPVMLPATGTAKMLVLLKDPGVAPDRINIAATPWSAWSSAVEKTVLPVGQNVLPLSNSSGTVEMRPVFEWRSNEANASYELWVENRATKQRVIWKTHFERNSFQSTTDLPPGQYDWWVRIEETTGPRNGWSPKQSLEIYAPAILTNVAAETVDATPVVSWTANAAAQSFTVIVTSVATGKVVYQGTAVRNQTSHRVPTALPNDTYTVSIQALFSNGARSAPGVAKADGTFAMPKMLVGAAPKVTARSSSIVTWTAVNGATKYEIWINHVDLTSKVVHLATEQTFETTYQLPAALAGRSGQYRIWVRAVRNESGQTFAGRWSSPATIGSSTTASINLRSSTDLLTVMSELATSGPPIS